MANDRRFDSNRSTARHVAQITHTTTATKRNNGDNIQRPDELRLYCAFAVDPVLRFNQW